MRAGAETYGQFAAFVAVGLAAMVTFGGLRSRFRFLRCLCIRFFRRQGERESASEHANRAMEEKDRQKNTPKRGARLRDDSQFVCMCEIELRGP